MKGHVFTMNIDVNTASTPNSLMIDTGANIAVFNDQSFFCQLQKPNTHSCVRFGPSASFAIEGQGTVQFNISDLENNPVMIHLTNVMYVPSQPHNIICLRNLRSIESGVNFDQSPYYIRWHVNGKDCYQSVHFTNDIPRARVSLPLQRNSVRKLPPQWTW